MYEASSQVYGKIERFEVAIKETGNIPGDERGAHRI